MSNLSNETSLVPAPVTLAIPPETKFVYAPNDPTPRVSSRDVAKQFEKEHKHVLAQIRELKRLCPYDFNRQNFRPVEYRDAKGQMRSEFLLARDGFYLTAFGFTGAKALMFKLAYMAKFNAMEAALEQVHLPLEAARRLLALSPLMQGRLKKVLGYMARGFSRSEMAAVMKLHPRSVGQLITDAKSLGLLPGDKKEWIPAEVYTREGGYQNDGTARLEV